jgi:hypothetical protein
MTRNAFPTTLTVDPLSTFGKSFKTTRRRRRSSLVAGMKTAQNWSLWSFLPSPKKFWLGLLMQRHLNLHARNSQVEVESVEVTVSAKEIRRPSDRPEK